MGKEQLAALMRVLEQQQALGSAGVIGGTWNIHFDQTMGAFLFEKCEFADYCEERPAIIALDGTVRDPGGPLLKPR